MTAAPPPAVTVQMVTLPPPRVRRFIADGAAYLYLHNQGYTVHPGDGYDTGCWIFNGRCSMHFVSVIDAAQTVAVGALPALMVNGKERDR